MQSVIKNTAVTHISCYRSQSGLNKIKEQIKNLKVVTVKGNITIISINGWMFKEVHHKLLSAAIV